MSAVALILPCATLRLFVQAPPVSSVSPKLLAQDERAQE